MAAQKPAYAALLAAREITAAFIAQLVADIKACRDLGATAVQATTGKTVATDAAHTAETNLMTAIHEVQAAARQKYARTNPVVMHDYMVSQRINQNQATFKQSVEAIIKKLAADTLPGITPAKVANLQPLLTAYTAAAANPDSQQSDATTQRKQRDAAVNSITDRRATVQFAADAEWPFTNPANAGIRGEFFLPLSQPLHG
jgi:endonuclease IV